MAKSNVVQFHPRAPRYSPAIAAESWMEVSERARRLVTFAEAELLHSFAAGDLHRLRELQALHADASVVMDQGRRMAGWADATACADGKAQPGHGAAA